MDAVAFVGFANAAVFGRRALVRPWTGLPLAGFFVLLLDRALPARAREYRAADATQAPTEVLALLLFVDFAQYWVHTLTHWLRRRAHAVHHRHVQPTPAVAFDTGLEDAASQVLLPVTVAVYAVAPSRVALVAFGALYSLWLQFIHGDAAVPRAAARVLVSPAFHRAHHKNPRKNLGHVFVLWDRAFGTEARADEAGGRA